VSKESSLSDSDPEPSSNNDTHAVECPGLRAAFQSQKSNN